MKPNVGRLDRIIRLVLAVVLFYLGFVLYSGSALGVGLIVGGSVLLATALLGFCGLYQLLGIHTRPANPQS